jgi:WD40 repeat protein
VQVWDGQAGRPIGRALLHGGVVGSVAISPDGRLALVGTGDTTTNDRGLTHRGETHLWDIATGLPVGPVAELPDHVTNVAFSPDGTTYILASYHGPAQLRETPTPMPGDPARIADDASLVTGLRFDADDMIVTLDASTRRDLVRRRSGEGGR